MSIRSDWDVVREREADDDCKLAREARAESPFAPGFGQLQNLTLQDMASLTERPAVYAAVAPPASDLLTWRVSKGLSQFQAAVHAGVSLSTWIRWERNGVPPLRQARVREMLK